MVAAAGGSSRGRDAGALSDADLDSAAKEGMRCTPCES